MEDIETKHDEFLKQIYAGSIAKAFPLIPEKYEPEDISQISKNLEKVYSNYFKTDVVKKLRDYFKDENSEGLEKIIMEIKNNKISFKNIKSKILYHIEGNEEFNKEEKEENKFSLETQVTVEEL